jgi:hypothetical protein
MELSSAVPILAVLAGGLVGWFTERRREKRDMRRAAYVEWLKAARLLASWPVGEGSVEVSMKVRLPHPVHQAALNDRTTEVSLLASPRVLKAIDEYVDRLHHVDLAGAKSFREAFLTFDSALEPNRAAVIDAMRRDLGTRKLPRDLMAAPATT